ncbi:Uncharacterised protein [Chryseobacterium carnipullorum]|uniref:Uncharacterized protein n=1 Tax=Chryseobacterium carnipullorum TaxID=1124835 RepID=A0A376DRK7_CHRCU|nr:Uncharacterised protein [Chryseobacterium carnipullorum]
MKYWHYIMIGIDSERTALQDIEEEVTKSRFYPQRKETIAGGLTKRN